MENKKKRRSKTKIIPPQKNNNQSLSRDEVRSINKKKMLRRRKAKRLALLWLLGIVVVASGIILMMSLFFKINTIEIKGEKIYPDKTIISKSNIDIGSNLFSVNEEKINKALTESLPYIKNVKINKKLPDKLVLTVTASREVAAIQNAKDFTLIDSQGKVLDKDSAMLRDGVAVVNGIKLKNTKEGKIIEASEKSKTNEFIILLKAIKESEIDSLTEINFLKKGGVELQYDGRIKIKIGSIDDHTLIKLQRAKKALEQENENNAYAEGILDLRTEPYAYFNAGKDEPTTKAPTTVKPTEEDTIENETEEETENNQEAND